MVLCAILFHEVVFMLLHIAALIAKIVSQIYLYLAQILHLFN